MSYVGSLACLTGRCSGVSPGPVVQCSWEVARAEQCVWGRARVTIARLLQMLSQPKSRRLANVKIQYNASLFITDSDNSNFDCS